MTYYKPKKNFLFFIFNFALIFSFFLFPKFIKAAKANENSPVNNKFGIHLAQPHFDDLQKAKELVNSNAGDWGYITLVIQENDRSKEKWQEIFDRLREYHLIPIIRLATVPQGASWRRPAKKDASAWVDFLDSLNWVIKNRYVVMFNEPNHGAEWGGNVDAGDYADVALEFAKKLKEKNADFFIMLAGLDASAPHSPPQFEDEEVFLKDIINFSRKDVINHVFTLFDYVDGLASHSYPNPGFAGSPHAIGRGTVRTYQWELELLKNLGSKNLPVFITETGWIRQTQSPIRQLADKAQNLLSEEIVAQNYKAAFENVWLPDNRVVAVTPFVLDYQGEPFLNFSWKKYQNNDFYPQYYTIQALTKVSGEPEQIEKGKLGINLPKELVAHSTYLFKILIENQGQATWDKESGYRLSVVSGQEKKFEYLFSDIRQIRPYDNTEIDLYLKTEGLSGKNNLRILLLKGEKKILESREWKFEVFPLPSLEIEVNLFPKLRSINETGFELQIFDTNDILVFKRTNVRVQEGKAAIKEIQNVALGQLYRIVLLKPYYLPRQTFVMLSREKNSAKFEKMLPLDFNKNGKIDITDTVSLIKNPKLFTLFVP